MTFFNYLFFRFFYVALVFVFVFVFTFSFVFVFYFVFVFVCDFVYVVLTYGVIESTLFTLL